MVMVGVQLKQLLVMAIGKIHYAVLLCLIRLLILVAGIQHPIAVHLPQVQTLVLLHRAVLRLLLALIQYIIVIQILVVIG